MLPPVSSWLYNGCGFKRIPNEMYASKKFKDKIEFDINKKKANDLRFPFCERAELKIRIVSKNNLNIMNFLGLFLLSIDNFQNSKQHLRQQLMFVKAVGIKYGILLCLSNHPDFISKKTMETNQRNPQTASCLKEF